MFEFFIGILALGIGLFFWIATGHLMWVAIAAVFRSLKPSPIQENPQVFTRDTDLQIAAEVINRLRRGEALSEEAYQAARSVIDAAALQHAVPLENKVLQSTSLSAPPPILETLSTPNESLPLEPSVASSISHERVNDEGMHASSPSNNSIPVASTHVETNSQVPLHPLSQTYEDVDVAKRTEAARKKAIGELLAQFLNEKNIQWGELLSGLLIIGSAVGLILSLRSELNRMIPMFPIVLFFLVTVAIHLAGLYTLKRWKLPSTSRGLLWIGTLMMPITGLAACLLSDHQGEGSFLDTSFLVPMIGGGAVFAWMAYLSGRSLSKEHPWRWMLVVVPATLMLGVINRSLAPPISPSTTGMLTLGGWSGMLGITLLLLSDSYRRRIPWSLQSLPSELRLIGTAMMGALLATTFLWFRAQQHQQHLQTTLPWALPCAMASWIIAALSLYIGNRASTPDAVIHSSDQRWRDIASFAGTSGEILSLLGMIVSMVFAIPDARLFYWMGLAESSLLILFACLHRKPIWTLVSAVGASLVGWLVWQASFEALPDAGLDWAWVVEHFNSISTAYFSMVATILLGTLGAWMFRHTGERPATKLTSEGLTSQGLTSQGLTSQGLTVGRSHTISLWSVACLHMLLALLLAFRVGLFDEGASNLWQASLIIGLYATGLMVVASRFNIAILTHVASGLLLVLAVVGMRPEGWLALRLDSPTLPLELAIAITFLTHSAMVLGSWILWRWLNSGATSVNPGPTPTPLATEPRAEASQSPLIADAVPVLPSVFTRSLAISGVVTAILGFLGAIWWLGPEWLSAQAGCLEAVVVLLFVFRWILRQVPGSSWMFSYILASAGLCFVNMTLVRYPVLIAEFINFSSAYALLLSLLLGVIGFLTGWLKSANYRWLVGSFFIVLLLEQGFVWSHTMAYRPLTIFPPYCVFLPFLIPCIALLWLSIRLQRGYRVLAGFASLPAVAATLMSLFPNGGDFESFLYCLLSAPIAIAVAFAIHELWKGRANGETLRSTESVYEELMIGMGFIIMIVLWLVQYPQITNRFMGTQVEGFAIPAGAMLASLIVLLVMARIPLMTPRLGVAIGYGMTLLCFMHSPIIHQRIEDVEWNESTFSLIILGTVVSHAACWLAISLRGRFIHRWIRSVVGPQVAVHAGDWQHAGAWFALSSVGLSLCLAILASLFCFDPIDVQILAFVVVVCNGVLWLLSASTLPLFQKNRWLAASSIGLWCLFAVLIAWSGIEKGPAFMVWSNRIVRMTSMVTAATITLSGMHYWRMRRHALLELDRQQLGLVDESAPSDTESQPAVLSGTWKVLAFSSVSFVLLTIACLGSNRSDRGYPSLATEVLLLGGAMSAWTVCLLIEALHVWGNIARWNHRQRQRYVYLAQVLVGLLGVLLAISFPHWFPWKLREYWPLIALTIALAVQWLSHILRKRKIETIGEPLENFALALPVATAFGILAFSTVLEPDFVLALISLYYFVLSATKASSRWAMVGGVMANVALVLFWNRFPDLHFTKHPQLWMIPPALSLLLATHLERKRLNAESLVAVRYLALFVTFLSSTGEILLQGFGKELWPPMILVLLSLAAAILGMMLQVRSYLYTGTMFLMMAIIAMVSHAQQSLQHTWPWWALVFSLGVGILVLFAYFEKNKEKFQQLANRLRTWEG